MAEDDKRKLDIPWATLLPMVAALAGIVAQYKPLVSARPAAPSEKPVEVIADQDVDARLWQDPLGVVQKEKLALDSEIRLRRHSTAALSERIKESVQEPGCVLLLAVMLESGPYLEQAESRLRGRQAVLEGLSESGFIPIDGEHIGFVVESWPPSEEKPTDEPANIEKKPTDKPADDRSLLFAWERCIRRDDTDVEGAKGRKGTKNDFQQVFVLWLPAASFNPSPLGKFCDADYGTRSTSPQLEVRMIGPANSTGLQAMIREIKGAGSRRRFTNSHMEMRSIKFRFFRPAPRLLMIGC